MALSERERQMLEEMEEAIRAEDPRFASQMKGRRTGPGGTDRRRVAIGAVGAIVGLGLVLLGINTTLWIGVAGFVIIVAAVAYAFTPSRQPATLGVVGDDGAVKKSPPKSRSKPAFGRGGGQGRSGRHPRHGTFMERMEQRWEERRRQGW
ncbi:DUF3040 domain-containing protein [Janibacter cremeus]|uniref:DUF3040 domain-containing protein n=1 Tax=Janibacter cremeus TaxID=1285192 RepID=UPI0023F9FF11|nr:DUF3040 domain-containing protein [Janibacter cremeus]WEV78957.1 DUF3040 domain-containing protein [Janibacter cremeus]